MKLKTLLSVQTVYAKIISSAWSDGLWLTALQQGRTILAPCILKACISQLFAQNKLFEEHATVFQVTPILTLTVSAVIKH